MTATTERTPERVVPHDLEAEESLLGAMMLARDALVAGLDSLEASDFYLPAHAAIFSAMALLYAAGSAVDPITLGAALAEAGKLEQIGGRPAQLGIQASTPASANVLHYARIVIERATGRRALKLAGELSEAAYGLEFERLYVLAGAAERSLAPPIEATTSWDLDDLAAFADADDANPAKPWLIPGLFRLLETLILTGGEGWGKMTLLRQIAVCCAAGLHPFTQLAEGMPSRYRTLIVDLQEDQVDLAHELRTLRTRAGAAYEPGWLRAVSWPRGINLLADRDMRKLEGVLADHRPQLVVMGPLVRLYRAGPGQSRYSEDLVDELTLRLNDLQIRYGFGLMLEGHAGNDREGAESWRVRGSSVWRSWPRFGLGLEPVSSDPRVVKVHQWRGPGHAGRPWPRRLSSSTTWPWVLDDEDYARLIRVLGPEHQWLLDGAASTLDF